LSQAARSFLKSGLKTSVQRWFNFAVWAARGAAQTANNRSARSAHAKSTFQTGSYDHKLGFMMVGNKESLCLEQIGVGAKW
jgi:hypothetical protein